MIQVKRCEMILMNKTSQCIFEKARTLSLLVLRIDLKYVAVKRKLLALFRTKNTQFNKVPICSVFAMLF